MPTPAALLERYVEAKDLVRPELMSQIYAPDAVLTYSLATDTIQFPARVAGVEGMTRTLIVDFAAKYSCCKTYYVCESIPQEATQIALVPWLVLMREPAAACLRIGKGYYQWTVEQDRADGARVVAMHIHIERMDAVADADGQRLRAVHSVLPYPWLPSAVLHGKLEALQASDLAFSFVNDFKHPFDPRSLAA